MEKLTNTIKITDTPGNPESVPACEQGGDALESGCSDDLELDDNCTGDGAVPESDSGEDDLGGLVDTEERVREAMQTAQAQLDVPFEPLPSDIKEDELVSQFMLAGCGCPQGNGGKQCCTQFSREYVLSARQSCAELTKSELDLVILGQLLAFTNRSPGVVTASRHVARERERPSTSYFHLGKQLCAKTFRMLHTIGEKRLKNLMKSLKEDGLTPRIHGNTKRKPHNTLSFASVEYVVRFLLNYTEQNSLLLPGRVPGYSRTDIKLLPSSVSKRGIWRVYHAAAEEDDTIHTVAYATFCKLWKKLVPSVVIMKPMSDLCWQCHQNSAAILRAANRPDKEKSVTITDTQEHLCVVHLERSHYKTTCDEYRTSVTLHLNHK